MKIKLSTNAYSSLVSVANPNPVNWNFAAMINAIVHADIEMGVRTDYMFNTNFNAFIPDSEFDKVIKAIDKIEHLNTNKNEVIEYIRNAGLINIGLGMVDKIINDARLNTMRCGYTGKMVKTADAETWEHKAYLEDISYAPTNSRLWRLKSINNGEVITVTTDEAIKLANEHQSLDMGSVTEKTLVSDLQGFFELTDEVA